MKAGSSSGYTALYVRLLVRTSDEVRGSAPTSSEVIAGGMSLPRPGAR